MISLDEFMQAAADFALWFYHWTDSIYPFSDYDISLFWIFDSLLLTYFAWSFFPVDTEFEDTFDDDSAFVDQNVRNELNND